MTDELKVGSIVEVTDPTCLHYRGQGKVVGFKETEEGKVVRVWFSHDHDYLLDYRERRQAKEKSGVTPPSEEEEKDDPRTWDYSASELTPYPTWSMKALADRYFTNFYHSYIGPLEVFVPGATDCSVDNCYNNTTQRIIFNVWGTVCFGDVCDSCASKYNLKCIEIFPWKDRNAEVYLNRRRNA